MRFFRRGDDRPEKRPEERADPQGRSGADQPPPFTAQAETFVTIMSDLAPSLRLDFSPESLAALDGFIASDFDPAGKSPAPDGLQHDVGAYVGEVVRRHVGGRWADDGALVDVGGPVSSVNPIGKARKRFANGPEDSLAWFYETVRRHATGGG
jgi:hypothetical protein